MTEEELKQFDKVMISAEDEFNNAVKACIDFVRGKLTEQERDEIIAALDYQAVEKIKTVVTKLLKDKEDGLKIEYFAVGVRETRDHLKAKIQKLRRTEGILGIGGTTHRDGVVNEGYNQALDDVLALLEPVEGLITERHSTG